MLTIALDVMGGDHAPDEILQGAIQSLDEGDVQLLLVGPELQIKEGLIRLGQSIESDRFTIVNATEVVEMSESPSASFKRKKDSSIRVGIDLVKEGKANAFVSAGNTGAVMASATLVLGRIEGVERPAIATKFPSVKGHVLILDMGSNVDCKPSHLLQFGIMGHWFSKLCMDVENPRVGLLNIGEEEGKGNELTLATYPMLNDAPLNFIGNIESKSIMNHGADVVVCDGFLGNNILKFAEGMTRFFVDFFKGAAKKSLMSKLGLLFLYPALKRFKKITDYEEFGGAPLLGVNGVVIISHGSSHAKAIKNAIYTAAEAVNRDMINQITDGISGSIKAHQDSLESENV